MRDPSSMYIFTDRTLHCVGKRFNDLIFNPSLYPFATVYLIIQLDVLSYTTL